ncbi:MAG TPA: putative aminohydrolase SsnA [Victivallales bacterium]|nr:putative aminohydrolase SsnA [Victivallales bacterium]
MNSLLIKNGTVVTLGSSNRIIENGAVLVEGKTIKQIGKLEDINIPENTEIIDAKGKLIMPGYINQHMHFYSTFARGIMPKQPAAKNFPEILERLWWPLDKALNEKDIYYSSMVPLINGIKSGTTTVFDHHESQGLQAGCMDIIENAVRETGVRGNLSLGLSDRYGKGQEGIDENIRFLTKLQKHISSTNDDIVTGMFALHALFTVNETSLKASCEAANDLNVGFHVHTGEDASDQLLNKKEYNKSVIKRLYDAKGLGNNTTAIHCIHMSDEEFDILAETNTPVIHIPQSNMNNAVGVADVLKMMEKNILVGIGTDGMSPRMVDDVRVANIVHKLVKKDPSIFFCESCQLLLENNSKIASRFFKHNVGVLEENSYADIILVDYIPPTPLNESTLFGHFLFGICEANIDSTIINGKILMKDGSLLNLDEEKIMAESRVQAADFWKRF